MHGAKQNASKPSHFGPACLVLLHLCLLLAATCYLLPRSISAAAARRIWMEEGVGEGANAPGATPRVEKRRALTCGMTKS